MCNKSPNGKQSKVLSMALKSMTGYGEGERLGWEASELLLNSAR